MRDEDQVLRLAGPPGEGEVLSTTRPQRLVALAHDANSLTRGSASLHGLSMAGHSLVLMWSGGTPGPELDDLTERHPLSTDGGERLPLDRAIDRDAEAQRLLSEAEGVIGFGERARALLDEVARGRTTPVPQGELKGWSAVSRTWAQLQARAEAGQLTSGYARHLAVLMTIVREPAPPEVQVALTDLVAEMERSGRRDEAIALLPHLRPSDEDRVESARRRAVLAQVRTSAEGAEDPDLWASAADLITMADAVLADGDLDRVAALVTLCLGSFFHAELHADVLSTPLVADPEDFLAAWRSSRVAGLLDRPVARPGRRGVRPTSDRAGRRVLVARGSYPRFAEPVIADLRARPGVAVEVLDWGERAEARGLGVRGELVETRLRAAAGQDVRDPQLVARFEGVDSAFIDWADRGALLALMHVPEGVRVTLRIHSMDALSPWVHLIDWSVVDHLVLVSDHLRDVVVRLLGDRLDGTETHVVPNTVDLSRIPLTKSTGHLRRLLMVGWAPRVKDVEWALDVLDALRDTDPRWRLTLVGPDAGSRTAVRSSREHAKRVRERLTTRTDGAVDIVPETTDLAPYWSASGFALNTSRRESFGLALVETVAARAVPVVRNWPIFAPVHGARRMFPREWVVDTVDEAAERIRAHADATAWAREADAARAFVEEHFVSTDPSAVLGDITLGAGRFTCS